MNIDDQQPQTNAKQHLHLAIVDDAQFEEHRRRHIFAAGDFVETNC
jgi:hypothetical protein